MGTRKVSYRRYDTAVKETIARSRNPNLFADLRIPRSTALYWIKSGVGRSYERPAHDGAAGSQGDGFQDRPPRLVSFETSSGSLLLETFKEVYALFRSLKHQHLHYRALRDIKTFTNEAAFYLREHNERMPHNALNGATPLENYIGSWTSEDLSRLQKERRQAAAERIRANRAARCAAACPA